MEKSREARQSRSAEEHWPPLIHTNDIIEIEQGVSIYFEICVYIHIYMFVTIINETKGHDFERQQEEGYWRV